MARGSFPGAPADLDTMVTEILLTEEVRDLATGNVIAILLPGPGRGPAARQGRPATLRSLDAIHAASAPAIGEALDSLITYDKRILHAAREAGLAAFAPGMAD